jgi:hypothetical protein
MKAIKVSILSPMLSSALLLILATPVLAHHSFAGYDMTKTFTANATLKEFRWGAPHSAVVFMIKRDGKDVKLTLASATPSMYVRQGFQPKDFKVGDRVEIGWHPSRSGAIGGSLQSIKLPDGRLFNDVEFSRDVAAQQRGNQGGDSGRPPEPAK